MENNYSIEAIGEQREDFSPVDLLEFLSEVQGQRYSRDHLHKLCYILKHKRVPGLSEISYNYDLHGPYSRELSDTLYDLVIEHLVEEKLEEAFVGSNGFTRCKYSYAVSPTGQNWCQKRSHKIASYIHSALVEIDQYSEEAIMLSCSVLFLTKECGRKEIEALEGILEANPLLKPHYEHARDLMVSITSHYA